MTDWSQQRWTEPPPLTSEQAFRETMDRYAASLANLPGTPQERITRLHALLADVSARLQTQASQSLTASLMEYAQMQDRLVLRSTRTEPQRASSPDRGSRESSPQPTSADLLSSSGRIGPRLATKLILASARSRTRR